MWVFFTHFQMNSIQFCTTTFLHLTTAISRLRTSTQKLFLYDRWNIKAAIFHQDVCGYLLRVCVCWARWRACCSGVLMWLYLVHFPLNNHNLSNAMHEVSDEFMFLQMHRNSSISLQLFSFISLRIDTQT